MTLPADEPTDEDLYLVFYRDSGGRLTTHETATDLALTSRLVDGVTLLSRERRHNPPTLQRVERRRANVFTDSALKPETGGPKRSSRYLLQLPENYDPAAYMFPQQRPLLLALSISNPWYEVFSISGQATVLIEEVYKLALRIFAFPEAPAAERARLRADFLRESVSSAQSARKLEEMGHPVVFDHKGRPAVQWQPDISRQDRKVIAENLEPLNTVSTAADVVEAGFRIGVPTPEALEAAQVLPQVGAQVVRAQDDQDREEFFVPWKETKAARDRVPKRPVLDLTVREDRPVLPDLLPRELDQQW